MLLRGVEYFGPFVEGFDGAFDSRVDEASGQRDLLAGGTMMLSVLMYPDADRVVGSCGEPRAKLATESKMAPMEAGLEGVTAGRSWDG